MLEKDFQQIEEFLKTQADGKENPQPDNAENGEKKIASIKVFEEMLSNFIKDKLPQEDFLETMGNYNGLISESYNMYTDRRDDLIKNLAIMLVIGKKMAQRSMEPGEGAEKTSEEQRRMTLLLVKELIKQFKDEIQSVLDYLISFMEFSDEILDLMGINS